jgi:hypothetical protein
MRADTDPERTHYTFERAVNKTDGAHCWADVWLGGHFGWECKIKHKNVADHC